MSTHIAAKEGEIASRVLLPGDPLRAKFIAETFLENVRCYSTVRNMLGFTGTYKGKEVSVQGTGMGAPSHGIYVNELIQFYGAKRLIRTGTCGSIDPTLKLKDIAIIQAAAADSGMNHSRFGIHGLVYPPVADFNLLRDAVDAADKLGYPVRVCTAYSGDQFYDGKQFGALHLYTWNPVLQKQPFLLLSVIVIELVSGIGGAYPHRITQLSCSINRIA